MTDEKPIRTGIAGLGRSGWHIHAETLEPLQDRFDICAVFDKNEERINEAGERFGCTGYTDLKDLLGDDSVSLIINALPSHLHAEKTIEALQAGKDVVCEKPMATALEDADRMIDTAEQEGRLLTIFQNRRYDPVFMKIREIIDSGILGEIILIHIYSQRFSRRWDWQTLKKFGGGTLNNTGPHVMDQALVLFGDNDPEILCDMRGVQTLGDTEDHVKIVLKAEGAPTIDIEITSTSAYSYDTWLIMGSQGGLTSEGRGIRWKYFDPAELPERKLQTELEAENRSYCRDEIPWKEEQTWEPGEDTVRDNTAYYLDLYDRIQNGSEPEIDPRTVRRQIETIQKCHEIAGI